MKVLDPIRYLVSYVEYKRDRLRIKNLIESGLKVGKNVYIGRNCLIDSNYPYLIEIGDNCRITSFTLILAHDATGFRDLGITRIAPVKILEDTFIGYGAIILPGVTIGPRALIAAGSVVNRDIGEGKAAAGNPARPYSTYSEILGRYHEMFQSRVVFQKEDMENGLVSAKDILKEIEKDKIAFVHGFPRKDPYYINLKMDELRKKVLKNYEELRAASARSRGNEIKKEKNDNFQSIF